jgi:hypothetical protein
MAKIKISEKDIQSFILKYLNNFGFFWRNNTTGIYDPHKKCFRKNNQLLKGVPDILGVYLGRFIAIECKSSSVKKLSDDQEIFRIDFEKRGGIFYMANDIDDFVDWFDCIKVEIF